MNIPTLNPLRFYKENGTKLKDNLSFAEASDYWNALNGAYTPKFLNQMQSIAYEDEFSGAYGFTDISEFTTTSAVNPRIENCQLCVDSGRIIYSNLDFATTGRRVAASFVGPVDIEVRENSTVLETFTAVDGFISFELPSNYSNLNLTFDSTGEYCVKGVMLCEDTLSYSACGDTIEASLIDICPRGGVYLIELYDYYLQVIDYLPLALIFTSGVVDIEINYANGDVVTGTTDGASAFEVKVQDSLDLMTAISKSFVSPNATIRGNEITSVIYEQGATRVTLTPDSTESFNVNCCRIEIGDYISEYFSVITETEKNSLRLLEVGYSSEFMDKEMAFSSYWDAKFLVNSTIKKSSGADVEVFIGQSRNTNLQNNGKRLRRFVTGAIPDYMCDLLGLVFGFDSVTIEGVSYGLEDTPDESEFEDRTDLFQFEAELRQQNFEFVI